MLNSALSNVAIIAGPIDRIEQTSTICSGQAERPGFTKTGNKCTRINTSIVTSAPQEQHRLVVHGLYEWYGKY